MERSSSFLTWWLLAAPANGEEGCRRTRLEERRETLAPRREASLFLVQRYERREASEAIMGL